MAVEFPAVPTVTKAITILEAALNENLDSRGSTPRQNFFLKRMLSNDGKSIVVDKTRKKQKKSTPESKELRDQEMQSKRGNAGAQTDSWLKRPQLQRDAGSRQWGWKKTVQQPILGPSTVAEATEAMDIEPVSNGSSIADDDTPSLLSCLQNIPAGQRPQESKDMWESPPAISLDSEPTGDIPTITLAAMEKMRRKRLEDQKQRPSINKH